jgi:hypothetical protein
MGTGQGDAAGVMCAKMYPTGPESTKIVDLKDLKAGERTHNTGECRVRTQRAGGREPKFVCGTSYVWRSFIKIICEYASARSGP